MHLQDQTMDNWGFDFCGVDATGLLLLLQTMLLQKMNQKFAKTNGKEGVHGASATPVF